MIIINTEEYRFIIIKQDRFIVNLFVIYAEKKLCLVLFLHLCDPEGNLLEGPPIGLSVLIKM